MRHRWELVVVLALVSTVLLAGCAGGQVEPTRALATPIKTLTVASPTQPPELETVTLLVEPRQNEGGGLEIEVKPAGVKDGKLLFSVALNTHSVDLSYDYAALASLKDDQGREYPALAWEGGKGGHHLEGTLVFARDPLLQPDVKWLELRLKDIAEVPLRTFRWEVKRS